MRLNSRLYLYSHFKSKREEEGEEKKNEVFSFKSNIEHNSNTDLKEISISNTLFNILKVTS